jgi:mannitol 2-dehydrogenase
VGAHRHRSRLSRRGSTKVPNYVLPSVRAAREAGRGYELLALAVAGWIRFLRGCDHAGDPLPVEDPRTDLILLARESGVDPRPVLRRRDVFGELGTDEAFTATVTAHLEALDEGGPRDVIAQCLDAIGRSRR